MSETLTPQHASEKIQQLKQEIGKWVVGQTEVVDQVIIALLAGGHILIEGVPGLGKTLIVKALAQTMSCHFKRIQFTPDLMPSDVTGHAIYDMKSESFKIRKGPIFTHFLLADEINRAPAKTQAALLEAMQEQQITIEGKPFYTEHPFMVLATQNPIEQEGTYPLPEAELDRFLLKVLIDYPNEQDEVALTQLNSRPQSADKDEALKLTPTLTPNTLAQLQQLTCDITMDDSIVEYAVRLARTTRSWPGIILGAGPRAAIALSRCAKAYALLNNRDFVIPDDIKQISPAVFRHRISLSAELEIEGVSADKVVQDIINQVEAPRQ